MIDVHEITQLHADTVQRWHRQEIDNPFESMLEVVCRQHQQKLPALASGRYRPQPGRDRFRPGGRETQHRQTESTAERSDRAGGRLFDPRVGGPRRRAVEKRAAEHRNAGQRDRQAFDPLTAHFSHGRTGVPHRRHRGATAPKSKPGWKSFTNSTAI